MSDINEILVSNVVMSTTLQEVMTAEDAPENPPNGMPQRSFQLRTAVGRKWKLDRMYYPLYFLPKVFSLVCQKARLRRRLQKRTIRLRKLIGQRVLKSQAEELLYGVQNAQQRSRWCTQSV